MKKNTKIRWLLLTLTIVSYNKEIEAAIASNKKELLKAKTPKSKQQITSEIKQLETTKKENNQLLASNNKQIQTLNTEIAKNNSPVTSANEKSINLNPINANNGADALKNLDELNNQLSTNDNSNFEYNSYQNADAQKLKIEADSEINNAAAQQKKLKDLIPTAKEEIKKTESVSTSNNSTSTQLNIEAEELFNKAQKLRGESQTKTGTEKDKLLNEAKAAEEEGNEKNLQAAEITKTDNATIYTTNTDNLNTLIDGKKASETDIAEAKKLMDEANVTFKQATSIREESNSLTNIGAKLGGLSNAEEKEALALNKQQQALDLLKKSDATANLKIAVTSTLSIKEGKDDNLVNTKLDAVNTGINDLAATKTAAYQKMQEANALEIEQLNNSIKTNETLILNTPSLKSESITVNNKVTAANELKQRSDAATNNTDKLNNLIAATKKQIEAINQLNNLNKKVNNQITTNTAKEISTANNTVKDNTTNEVTTNDNSTTNNTVNENNGNSNTQIIDTKTVSVNELSKTDTTAQQLLSFFENTSEKLNNPQANSLKTNAINELKKSEIEKKQVESEINNYKDQNPVSSKTPAELKTKADALLIESENLSNKASELKNEADTASGNIKDSLIAKANELENTSQNQKVEASELTQQSNEIDYKNNNNAITELLTKLKTDNPTLLSELEQKNNEINTLKTQSQKLREEANAQSNPNAKIGALSNAEEKEAEYLIKQNQLIAELKKQYPDYVVTPLNNNNASGNTNVPNSLIVKQKQIQEKQSSELTNLTNALTLEYETAKIYIPKDLNNEQLIVKQNAEDLNSESKNLLLRSTQVSDAAEKTKLLTLAAKTGNAANEQLSKIIGTKAFVSNSNSKNNTNTPNNANPKNKTIATANKIKNNPNAVNTANAKNNTAVAANKNPKNTKSNTTVLENNNTATIDNANPGVNNDKGTVKIEGLEVVSVNAYNNEKPIPIDAKMQDGLVFRVQIGAFKTQLANDAFKGLSPLNGETAGNGYIRYTAGNFTKFENAGAVKNDLRNLGYSDAFVVAFFNGKRITVAEAIALLNKEGKTIDNNAPTSAGITANSNVPKANTLVTQPNLNSQDLVTVTKELEQINGLLFTVQIGVYNRQITKGQLRNLGPIFSEKLPSGLYRYTAGIYNDPERLLTDKRRVVDLGISDAFVSAYLNGKRISFAEGKDKKANDATIKLETENPIIFPEGGAVINTPAPTNTPPVVNTPLENNIPTTTVKPFTNGVTAYPAATPENGVKPNEEGISFKVQIGAYSKQIPNDVAARFSAIKNWPIENKQINSLFIYNIGNFTDARFAKSLKEQAVSIGITDAFITVYKDGKKVYGSEAAILIGR